MRWIAILPLLSSCGLFGGGSPCKAYCEQGVECIIDQLDEYGIECEWDDEDEALDTCIEICEDVYSDLDGDEKKTVRECFACVEEEMDGSCDGEDYYEAVYDDCEDLCDDNDVEDFFEDFGEDWEDEGEDMLECDYGSYYYSSSSSYSSYYD